MKTSELLREGYDQLLIKGWGQGISAARPGRLCMMDAVPFRAYIECGMGLARAIGIEDWHSVIGWNDAPGRTFDEVCDAFQRAIKLAEADEATT